MWIVRRCNYGWPGLGKAYVSTQLFAEVQRFANKTIAITGYEIDQVRQTPQGDVPVPITHAYSEAPQPTPF